MGEWWNQILEDARSLSKLGALILLLIAIGVIWLFSRKDQHEGGVQGASPGFVIFVCMIVILMCIIRLLFIWP
jgi:hypothetical protein